MSRIFRLSGNLLSIMIVTEIHLGFKGARDTRKGLVLNVLAPSRRQEVDVEVARASRQA